MIPIQLTIEGLYSYQKRTVIDFEQLTRYPVFGIFGPVGSGKSAILEAITFALYGETERMSSRGRNYNMMNLRSQRLFIEFIFETGRPDERSRYKFTVDSSRNSKKFEDVRKYKRQGYQWQTNAKGESEWIPLESSDAGKILGLSYDNFTKTIIVPQGKFKEFLHATLSDAERNSLLEELFHLHQYDLAAPTKALLMETDHELEGLKGQLMEVGEVDAEMVGEKEQAVVEREEKLVQLGERIEELVRVRQELKGVKDLEDGLNEVQEILGKLEPDEAEMDKREELIRRYEAADKQFSYLLKEQERLQGESAHSSRQQSELAARNADFQVQLEESQRQLAEIEGLYERRQELLERAADMERMAGLGRMQEEKKSLNRRLKEEEMGLKETESALERYQTDLKTTEATLDQMAAQLQGMENLRELQEWFREKERREGLVAEKKAAWELKQSELKDLEEVFGNLLAYAGWEDQSLTLATLRDHIAQLLTDFEDRRKSLELELNELEFKRRLGDFADQLEEGKPCPLCGATHHPERYHVGTAEEHYQNRRAEHLKTVNQLKPLPDWDFQARGLQGEEARLKTESAVLAEALEEAQQSLVAHQSSFHWRDFAPDDPAAVQNALAAAQALQSQREAQDRARRQLQREVESHQGKLRQQDQALAQVRADQAGLEARQTTLEGELTHFQWANYQAQTPTQLQLRRDEFRRQHQELVDRYQTLRGELERRQTALQQLGQELATATARAEEARQQLERTEAQLNRLLATGDFGRLEEVEELLQMEMDVEEERRVIQSFREDLRDLRNNRTLYQEKLAGRQFDPAAFKAAEAEWETRSAEKSRVEQELGALREQLVRLQEALQKRLRFLQKQDQLMRRRENLAVIAKLFKAKGFVKYVSTQRLQELARRANQRFMALTQNQLSLELNEDNAFQVRDRLNDGHYRHIKTLSGGQTFQAALSLALALADTIQAQNASSSNFFFLDEGFGTLDKASLSIVFDALQQLRNEDRIVGVISHVEELQQEIPVSLQVEKDPEHGSRVRGSWE